MKEGTIWITPNDFVDHDDEKLLLNIPASTLARFSKPIEFFQLFFTEDLLDLIFDQTKLSSEWRNLTFSVRKVQNIEIEDIRKVA